MKTNSRLALIALLSGLILVAACQSKTTKQYVARIDSLLVQLDSTWGQYQTLDTNMLFSSYNTFLVIIDSFNLYFDDNPQDSSFYIATRFSQIKGPLKSAVRLYGKVGYEIEVSGGQLRTLRNDARHKRWDDTQMEKHLSDETNAIKSIKADFNDLKENTDQSIQMLEIELPRMRSVIEAMKLKRGNV